VAAGGALSEAPVVLGTAAAAVDVNIDVVAGDLEPAGGLGLVK